LNVLITGYPSFFSRIWQNKFESKQAGLTFEFNESFEMLVPDGKKIPFTRDKKLVLLIEKIENYSTSLFFFLFSKSILEFVT
jgi:hypothetical protein